MRLAFSVVLVIAMYPDFTGIAEKTLLGSKPAWAPEGLPPKGAPNILAVLLGDAGFGNPSIFGGPVSTPTLGAMAAEGLRFNGFHVTALCSQTRAALLSGRNHHVMGLGSIADHEGGALSLVRNSPLPLRGRTRRKP